MKIFVLATHRSARMSNGGSSLASQIQPRTPARIAFSIDTESELRWWNGKYGIDLIRGTIFDYVIHFRMAKEHERPYATVC